MWVESAARDPSQTGRAPRSLCYCRAVPDTHTEEAMNPHAQQVIAGQKATNKIEPGSIVGPRPKRLRVLDDHREAIRRLTKDMRAICIDADCPNCGWPEMSGMINTKGGFVNVTMCRKCGHAVIR